MVECDAHTVKTTWPVRPSTDEGSDEGFIRVQNGGTVDKNQIEFRTVKVDNAKEVASLPDDNPFRIPENLDIWNPENGAVVRIN